MYRKNVASQYVFAQMNSRTDGSPLTSGVSVNVAVDNAAQGAGSGTLTHLGNGQWKYALTQAETNGNQIAVQFTHASGVNVGFTLVTTAADPTSATTFGISNLDAAITSRAAAATALTNATWTDAKAGYLDTAVSSRSTYAGADTSGTTTLLSRLSAGRATNLDNLDAAVSTRSTLTAQQVWEYTTRTLSSFGTLVSDIATAVWAAGTRTLSAFGFSVTVGTNSDKTGYSLASAPPTAAAIADAVWDEAMAGHLTAGTAGASLNGAGAAGDPWTATLPGSYGAGTAGYIVGNRLDTTVGSRLATSGYTAPDNTSIIAIKAKTDNLPVSPAAVGSAMTLTAAYDAAKAAATQASVDTLATYVDTEVAAIKAKTDQLSFTGGNVNAAATVDVDETAIANAVDAKLTTSHGAGSWVSAAAGSGVTAVNHDTGGADALAYKTADGAGIDNATIKVFLKSDYDAGNRTDAFLQAASSTNALGRWVNDCMLDSGLTYTIVFYKQGQYGPDTMEVTP